MSVQHFFTAASAIPFPQLVKNRVQVSAVQLRKLFWHASGQKLVGVFTTVTADYPILSPNNSDLTAVWRMVHLWRDGTPIDPTTLAIKGHGQIFLPMTHTATGAVLMRNIPSDVAGAEISAASQAGPDALFPISERWAMDIVPLRWASAGVFVQNRYDASYLVTSQSGYIVLNSTAATTFAVMEQPSGTRVFSATGSTWRHARDLLYIDDRHAAAVFMQDSGGTVNADVPALIRYFSTTSATWSLLWTDTLPATDSVAAYDPLHQILYSTGKWPSTATIHASKLMQSPVSLSTITLVSGSALQELTATRLSVNVVDSQASLMSGVLVHWSLSASVSGGTLVSTYSRTNVSGVATITYIGPQLSGTATSETVSAAVATIDPVGRG